MPKRGRRKSIINDPHEPGTDDGFSRDDDDTQQIPVVTGGVDYSTVDYGYDNTYDADGTSTRPESTSTYELLPSDAFAPTTTRKSRRFAIIAAACIVILGVIAIGAYTA
ncbi:hypothetical protein, partial [Gordonia sp. (in: high G+C Gram-positive bacteria)]